MLDSLGSARLLLLIIRACFRAAPLFINWGLLFVLDSGFVAQMGYIVNQEIIEIDVAHFAVLRHHLFFKDVLHHFQLSHEVFAVAQHHT
jgi:hypothetical protein